MEKKSIESLIPQGWEMKNAPSHGLLNADEGVLLILTKKKKLSVMDLIKTELWGKDTDKISLIILNPEDYELLKKEPDSFMFWDDMNHKFMGLDIISTRKVKQGTVKIA